MTQVRSEGKQIAPQPHSPDVIDKRQTALSGELAGKSSARSGWTNRRTKIELRRYLGKRQPCVRPCVELGRFVNKSFKITIQGHER